MADVLTKAQRARCMSRIRGKNTTPELRVRSVAHRLGYRFRLHRRDLPGKPDLVFPSRRKIILVHGCFWHLHACPKGQVFPKSNAEFWVKKRTGNVERDRTNHARLKKAGWKILTIWECQTMDEIHLAHRISDFLGAVGKGGNHDQ